MYSNKNIPNRLAVWIFLFIFATDKHYYSSMKHQGLADKSDTALILTMNDMDFAHGPSDVPHTLDMAMADIEEGEKQFENGETYTHEEVMGMVWDKIAQYAD